MKKFLAIILILTMMLGLMACGGAAPEETQPEVQEPGEYVITDAGTVTAPNGGNSRVFYHIFVGSFSDSNNDGVGDLRGIIDRMDYINDGDDNSGLSLGAEGIWLSPIFVSPSYHKYDTSDYYTIDPKFGTEQDLKDLIAICQERNVKLILDLVVNHTAPGHPWFQAFAEAHRNGDTENEYYDFYSWSAKPEAGKTYQLIGGASEYYECNFSGAMPELNFDNEAVRQAMVDVAKYYLDLGVDGFRFDAAKYIYYGETTPNTDFWDWYMGQLRAIKPDIYSVAEVWDGDGITFPYFSSTNCFNFSMAQSGGRIAEAAKGGDVNAFTGYVDHYLNSIHAINPDANMVTFIANHDTDRAAGFLPVSNGQAKVAANLSILLPGSTFVYYGEEIGMKGSRGGANTDANRRLAMNWGDGDTVRDPEGADYASGQTNGTAAEQILAADSLYNHYKKLIAIRKANPEIAYGDFTPLTTETELGGFLASYEGSTVAVLHNTTTEAVTVDLAELTDVQLTVLAAYAGVGTATLEGTVLTIQGQTSVVLR